MKHIKEHLWLRAAIVFVVVITLRVAWCRLLPHDDPEGSNLLVNVVFAAILTALYALIDHLITRQKHS